MGLFGNFFGDNVDKNTNTNTQSFGQGYQSGTGNTSNIAQSTPFLQWLASQGAGNALTGYNQGNGFIQQSAAPVTAPDISALRDPLAAQQYQQAAAMLQPQFEQDDSYERGRTSGQPYASSNSLGTYNVKSAHDKILANLAGQITQNAWAPAAGVAQQNAARMQSAGQGLNTAQTQYLSSIPGLVGSAGGNNVNTGQTANTSASTQYGTQNQKSQSNQQSYNPWNTVSDLGAGLLMLQDGGAVKGYDAGGAVSGPGPALGGTSGPGNENPQPPMPMTAFSGQPTSPAMPPLAPMPQIAQAPPAMPMPFSDQMGSPGAFPGSPPNPAIPKMFASGGAVGGLGGGHPEFHDKVTHAFKAFHAMRKHAQDGGVMGDAMRNQGAMDGQKASLGSSMGVSPKFQQWLGSHGRSQPVAPASAPAPQPDPMAQQSSSLGKFMSGLFRPQQAVQGFQDAGVVRDPDADYASPAMRSFFDAGRATPEVETTEVAPRSAIGAPYAPVSEAPSMLGGPPSNAPPPPRISAPSAPSSSGSGYLANLLGMSPERATHTAGIVSAMGGNKIAAHILNQQKANLDARRLAQEAEIASGRVNVNGTPMATIAAKSQALAEAKNPAEIAALEARSEPSQIYIQAVEAENKAFQARLDQLNMMQTMAVPGSATYKQEMDSIRAMRDRAMLTHQETLVRLHQQRATGAAPPVIEDAPYLQPRPKATP